MQNFICVSNEIVDNSTLFTILDKIDKDLEKILNRINKNRDIKKISSDDIFMKKFFPQNSVLLSFCLYSGINNNTCEKYYYYINIFYCEKVKNDNIFDIIWNVNKISGINNRDVHNILICRENSMNKESERIITSNMSCIKVP